MNLSKTLTTLACGAAAVLASGGLAHAAIYTSGDGTTTVVGTDNANHVAPGDANGYAFVVNAGDPLISGSHHPYNTTSIAGAQWVTAFQATPQGGVTITGGDGMEAASAANGGYYAFTQSFTSATSPFVLSGSVLSDNNLLGLIYDWTQSDQRVYTIAQLIAQGDAYSSAQQDPNGTGSYQTAFDFGPVVGAGAAPDAHTLSFVVQNQTQGSPNGYSNPASVEYSFGVAPAAVPEPGEMASFAIGGLGLLGLALRARRTRRADA